MIAKMAVCLLLCGGGQPTWQLTHFGQKTDHSLLINIGKHITELVSDRQAQRVHSNPTFTCNHTFCQQAAVCLRAVWRQRVVCEDKVKGVGSRYGCWYKEWLSG